MHDMNLILKSDETTLYLRTIYIRKTYATVWNSLTVNTRSADSSASFKCRL